MIHILTNRYEVIDPRFGREPDAIELDMGCGKGRFTLELAARYPNRIVLGSDVMLGRLRKVAKKGERRNLQNLELLRVNNLDLVAFLLPPGTIDRIHLLCPDPWPKERHRGKRLVNTDFLCRVARVLRPGGVIHLATDHAPYFRDWQKMLADLPFFAPAQEASDDVRDIETDFEIRWTSRGKSVEHMTFRLSDAGADRPAD